LKPTSATSPSTSPSHPARWAWSGDHRADEVLEARGDLLERHLPVFAKVGDELGAEGGEQRGGGVVGIEVGGGLAKQRAGEEVVGGVGAAQEAPAPLDADLDTDPAPEPAHDLRAALAGADAVLIATPEYNHSLPGQLKNALDWASRPLPDNCLRGTPVAVIGASTSMFGAVWAQAESRKVLGALGARVIDRELPVARADETLDEDGALRDPQQRGDLADILGRLAHAAAEAAVKAA
jgi:chromate reductase